MNWSITNTIRGVVINTMRDTSELQAELLQLDHIVDDCRDLEEPVPAHVRRRRAQLRRVLAEGGK